MDLFVDRSGSIEALSHLLEQASQSETVEGLLILCCDANGFEAEQLDPLIAGLEVPVIGGVFPELIYAKEKLQTGSIVASLSVAPEVHTIEGLSDENTDFSTTIEQQISQVHACKTMLVFVDGLASRIASLIEGLFVVFGLECNYIGGGAGSLSFEQRPCIITPQGLKQNCAVIGLLDVDSGIGVQHGWENISGPYKVTESDRTVIKRLDGKLAFDVYKEVVEKASGQCFETDNFFDIAKGYPFGINRTGDEKIVRDPIVLDEEGGLVCVGEVPQGSYVYILKGNLNSLVFAATKARALGEYSFPKEGKAETHLFIDCISRVLFLEDQFYRELEAVYDSETPLLGALTLGEIANFGKDFLEFYNKTAVLGVLGV